MKLEQLFLGLEFDNSIETGEDSKRRICDYKPCKSVILKNQRRVVQGNSVYHRECYYYHVVGKNKLARENYGN